MDGQVTIRTVTSTTLLEKLGERRDGPVWTEFVKRYTQPIVGFGRSLGLSLHDAEDAAQESLSAFAGAYAEGRYEREKGRLRTWLFAIAANHIKKTLRRRPSREVQVSDGSRGTGFFAGLPEDAELEEVWEAEWQRAVVQQCLSEVSGEFHDQTVAAFTLFVLQEWPAQRVADHLGMSRNAVYLAKFKILKKMSDMLPEMECGF